MILQALYEYYQRKSTDPENTDMAPAGWQWKEIPFVLVLDRNGKLVAIDDHRDLEKGKSRARAFLVPQEKVRPGKQVLPNILWDFFKYVFGYDNKTNVEQKAHQQAFIEQVNNLALKVPDEGLKSLSLFLYDTKAIKATAEGFDIWEKVLESTMPLAFRLDGDCGDDGKPQLICNRPEVASYLDQMFTETDAKRSFCLVTGNDAPIARTHAKIKNINNPEPNLVAFNADAFCSYGKFQGDNAPVSEVAAEAYAKALNYLLCKDSKQKIRYGNTSIVFWARKANEPLEDSLAFLIGGGQEDNPDARTKAISSLLNSPHKGGGAHLSEEDHFYILGISPNAARLSVRFWLPTTVASIQEKLQQYFNEIELVGGKVPYPPLRSLLSSLALEYKLDNLPPLLEGAMVESIFSGRNYPQTLLTTALQRMRAEHNIPHIRAALIKAYLIRNHNYKEISMSLNENHSSEAYQLGRLFAVLEKTQEEAMPGINATIRERYFASASTRPATVFPTLNKLHIHHLAKLENRGRATNLEKLVTGIVDKISAYEPSLKLEDQGLFAIGYYHQRQAFYIKKTEMPEQQAA